MHHYLYFKPSLSNMDETDLKIQTTKKPRSKFYQIILVVLVILLIISLVSFYTQPYWYRPVHRFFSAHTHRTLGVGSVNRIQNWMTFDYINKVFSLPKDYFKNTLNISDSHYPSVSLESYAEKEKINVSTFLVEVKDAVRAYITTKK